MVIHSYKLFSDADLFTFCLWFKIHREYSQYRKTAIHRIEKSCESVRLQKGPFLKEFVNNGRLVALRKADLQFRVGEQLNKLPLKNVDYKIAERASTLSFERFEYFAIRWF